MARKKGRYNAIHKEEDRMQAEQIKIWHVALYARLSVEQHDRPGSSIETQLDIMRGYIGKHPELSEYHEYVDRGFSGTNFERPDFNRLMEDVKLGRINCIIVKDLSRFVRDYLETTNYIEVILPFLGVRFISVNDHFDTEQECNENKALEVSLKNLANDMYAKDVSKRLVVTRKQEMERGRFTGSNAPYGYGVDETDPLRHYVIDESAAVVVRDIFRMASEGKSMRYISRTLQERNLSIPGQYLKTGHLYQEPGDAVKHWYVGTIGNILRNQAYIGNMVQGRRKSRLCENEKRHFTDPDEWIIVEGTHEPLVSRELFEQVRGLFRQKVKESPFSSQRGKDVPKQEDKYLNLLFCGKCGKRLRMLSKLKEENGKLIRVYYYGCVKDYDGGETEYCRSNIMEWLLDQVVFESIRKQIAAVSGKKDVVEFAENIFAEKLHPLEKAVGKAKADIEKTEFDGSRRYEEYVTGKISRADMEKLQMAEEKALKRQRGHLDRMEKKLSDRKRELESALKAIKAVYRMNSQADITRDLLVLMVDRINIYPDARVEIRWKFAEWFSDVSMDYGKGIHKR